MSLESTIIEFEHVGATYASIQMLNDKKLKIYRIYYDENVDISFFDAISNESSKVVSQCFIKFKCNWVNSKKETGYFYELFATGDFTLVKMVFEEFIEANNIKATIELSPANIITNSEIVDKYFQNNIPELYYFENEISDKENGDLYEGVPFLLSIDINANNIENFSKADIIAKEHMLGWWTDVSTDKLEINTAAKSVNCIKYSK